MFQIKQQDRIPETDFNKVEIDIFWPSDNALERIVIQIIHQGQENNAWNQQRLWLSDKMLWEFQAVPLKRPTHGLTQTHSLWAPVLEWQLEKKPGTFGGWEKMDCLNQGNSWWGSFLQDSACKCQCYFTPSLPQNWQALLYLNFHQPGSHFSHYPGDSLGPHPSLLTGSSKPFPVVFPYIWFFLSYALDFSKIYQTSRSWYQCALYLSISGSRPSISKRLPWVTAWPILGKSNLNRSSSQLQNAL